MQPVVFDGSTLLLMVLGVLLVAVVVVLVWRVGEYGGDEPLNTDVLPTFPFSASPPAAETPRARQRRISAITRKLYR